MASIGSVMTFGMNKILISFTTTATAVFGVYFKLQSFVFMPVFGLNNGMVPIVAYNYGAAQPKRIMKTIWLSIAYAVGIMLIGLAVFQLIPGTLLDIFNASDEMKTIGIPALRTISLSFFDRGVQCDRHVCFPSPVPRRSQPVGFFDPPAGGASAGGVPPVKGGRDGRHMVGLPPLRSWRLFSSAYCSCVMCTKSRSRR